MAQKTGNPLTIRPDSSYPVMMKQGSELAIIKHEPGQPMEIPLEGGKAYTVTIEENINASVLHWLTRRFELPRGDFNRNGFIEIESTKGKIKPPSPFRITEDDLRDYQRPTSLPTCEDTI